MKRRDHNDTNIYIFYLCAVRNNTKAMHITIIIVRFYIFVSLWPIPFGAIQEKEHQTLRINKRCACVV